VHERTNQLAYLAFLTERLLSTKNTLFSLIMLQSSSAGF
jgi:hypothetical protein